MLNRKFLFAASCVVLYLALGADRLQAQLDELQVPISIKADSKKEGEELAVHIEIENTGQRPVWIDPDLVLGFKLRAYDEKGNAIKMEYAEIGSNAPAKTEKKSKHAMQLLHPREKLKSIIYPFKKIEEVCWFSTHLPAGITRLRLEAGAKPKSFEISYTGLSDLESGPMVERLERLGKDYRKVALPKATRTSVAAP